MPNNTLEKWEEKKLGEICDFQGGSQPPKDEWKKFLSDGYVRMLQIRDFTQPHKTIPEYVKISNKLKLCNETDILIGRYGASVGKILTGLSGAYNVAIMKTIPDENVICKQFLKHYLTSRYFQDNLLKICTTRTAQAGFSKEDIFDFQIFLPSLSEQQRIVGILDEAFENIEKAKQNTLQNLNNAKELFESYANKILFNEDNCIKTTIGETCSLMTGGTPDTKNEEYYKNGTVKWLVSGDIHLGEITDCNGRITEIGLNNSNAKYLPVNSVLIALNGQGKTRGTVALLRTKATCNQSLVSIYPNNDRQLSTEYLYQNLRARYMEIRRMTGDSGNDRRGLNMPLIRSIKINIPNDIKTQFFIAEKLKNMQNEIKKLEQVYEQKLKDLDELKQSILKKAFNGEL